MKPLPVTPTGPLPFAVRSAEKLSVASVAALMRNNEGPRSLFHPKTQEMAVFQLRDGMPPAIGCVYWRTTGRPDSSVLTPWYAGITATPTAYDRRHDPERQLSLDHHLNPPPGTFDPDPKLAWWKFAALQDLVDEDYARRIEVVRTVWAKMEAGLFERQPDFEKQVADLMRNDRRAARAELTRYCAQQAAEACREADRLAGELGAGENSILCK